jgi:CTP:molybdopterin cytidylyltransferase MocA
MSAEDFAGLMLWDEALSAQPAKVQAAFKAWGIEAYKPDWSAGADGVTLAHGGHTAVIKEIKTPALDVVLDSIGWKIEKAPDGSGYEAKVTFRDGSSVGYDTMAIAEERAMREWRIDNNAEDGSFRVYMDGRERGSYADVDAAKHFAEQYMGAKEKTAQSAYEDLQILIDDFADDFARVAMPDVLAAMKEVDARRGEEVGALPRDYNAAELASVMLNNAGIPGHAFLDGVSRGASDAPAYNLVLYSDDVAKIMDRYARQTGEVLRGTDDPTGLTEALRQSFGRSTDAIIEAGNVKIVATPDDIPGGPHPGDVKAATAPDGTVYVVASNVSELEARGIMVHEVGVHVGMEKMLGRDVFQSVLKELDDAIGRGEEWAQAARGRVPADTPAGLVREEQLAYLVQYAPELPIVQRIIAAVRAWAYRTFDLAREKMTLSEGDFRAMAVAALHEAARGEQAGVLAGAYSRAQTATKAFKDWFGASMVVDADGQPLVVYHGTASDFDTFKPSKDGQYGKGIYFWDDPKRASDWAQGTAKNGPRGDMRKAGGAPSVMPVYIRNAQRIPGGWVVSESTDVKSATGNRGTFDPSNPDIRYSRGETPDPSTTKDELAPYDDAVKRAKGYASVLRAAADKLENDAQATAAMRAAMPDISQVEINELLGRLKTQVKGLRGMVRTARTALGSEDKAAMMQGDAMKAADELANNLELAAVIEKRNAALNINARLKATGYVNQFRAAGLDFEGFRGLLVGTERKRAGGRISVDAEQKQLRGKWLGGLVADLEKGELMRAFASGEFDREIYQALYNLGRDGAGNEKLPKEAVAIAEVVNKYQTDARNTRNRFGAWIRDLSGYITRQSHDMFKIRDAGEKAYKDSVLPLLDLQKSMRDFDGSADDFLSRVYDDFAAGSHMKTAAGEDDLQVFGAGISLARKESVSRVLYFKDGDAAYQYNQKFGQGRLAESVLGGMDHAAKSAGLLKMLGTNPQATVERLFKEYAESLRGDPARRAEFLSHRKELDNLLATVDGTSNIPGNATAAQISSFFRSWQTMSKLGGMLISSVTDLANYAAELRFGQDKNLLSGTLEGMGALTRGRAAGEKLAVLNSLGVFHESTLGAVFNRFDSPELMGGKTSWAMQQFFKLTGINWWTESLRDGYALAHASYVSSNAGKAFDKLPASLRDMFGLYNIDAGKWDILRLANTQQADGRMYITPEGLRTVPRAALANYITQVGRAANDASVANLQEDLASALRAMTIDRMHHAVIEPSARARAFMLRGTQPGTVPGELLRFMWQFKSFPVALIQMTLGREVYGRGYDTLGDYMKRGKGDMLGLASFIALSTAMGYAAMSAKDLLKGKNPRPVDDPRTWAAAMVQGGGLGLYGDFLFGKYNRAGGTLTGSMAGPVANLADTAADLWTRIRTGDDFAAVGFNALLQNTPFMNLFYTRIALDYLILHRIQEALNPGFLRRMEKKIERENGQTFYLPPSQVAR